MRGVSISNKITTAISMTTTITAVVALVTTSVVVKLTTAAAAVVVGVRRHRLIHRTMNRLLPHRLPIRPLSPHKAATSAIIIIGTSVVVLSPAAVILVLGVLPLDKTSEVVMIAAVELVAITTTESITAVDYFLVKLNSIQLPIEKRRRTMIRSYSSDPSQQA